MEDAEIVEGAVGTLLRIPSSVVAEATGAGLPPPDMRKCVRRTFLCCSHSSAPEGEGISDVAPLEQFTKPWMVYLVNQLEAHGYVERTADPVDGRAQRVRITERGAAAIHCVRTLVQQTESDWAARIGAPQLAELKRILRSLIASFEEHREATNTD